MLRVKSYLNFCSIEYCMSFPSPKSLVSFCVLCRHALIGWERCPRTSDSEWETKGKTGIGVILISLHILASEKSAAFDQTALALVQNGAKKRNVFATLLSRVTRIFKGAKLSGFHQGQLPILVVGANNPVLMLNCVVLASPHHYYSYCGACGEWYRKLFY